MIRIKENTIQKYELEHAAAIREIAAECTVLLKKDGKFPLQEPGKIAVFGSGARHTIKGGTGSGDVIVHQFATIEEGLENAGFEITTKKWLDEYDRIMYKSKKAFYKDLKEQAKRAGVPVTMMAIGLVVPEPEYNLALEGEGDTAIYCLARNSGEGGDRKIEKGDLLLTDTEIRDILALNEKYEKFMLALNVGGMVDLSPIQEVKNILLLGQLGSPTGEVLADILCGNRYPSGKLAMTWADIHSYPSTEGFGDINDTFYNEGIYVGYRYFEKAGKEVLYPFGYGLGYTDFEVSPENTRMQGTKAFVTAVVKNTGNFSGKEVVQIYFSAPGHLSDKPLKELAGYAKTKELACTESCKLELSFDIRDMASYDEEQAAYVLEAGEYKLWLGTDSKTASVCSILRISDSVVTKKCRNICQNEADTQRLKKPDDYQADETNTQKLKSADSYKETANGQNIPVIEIDASDIPTENTVYSGIKEFGGKMSEKITWREVLDGRYSIEDFAVSLTNQELAYLCCGSNVDLEDMGSIIGAASAKVAGAAGETTRKLMETHGLESIVLCDGPAGVRVSPVYSLADGKAKAMGMSFGEEMMEFLDEEDIVQMKEMMALDKPSEEPSEIFYQYCTAIPIGTALAQSFSREVFEVCGDVVGEEMELFGVQLWLAPALNIQRSPLCGRNFEYYSEDPLVSGTAAAAMTKSIQKHKNCGVTIKHFAANNQETNRYGSNSIVSERALREIYLKGFEICVRDAKPKAVMTSYNLVNGEHSCNSKDLLTYVLRDEWGFDGVVMTDWFITTGMMAMEGAKYGPASAAGCVKAGNNLSMPGLKTDLEDIAQALEGENHPYHITRDELICSVLPVLEAILENTKQ